MVIGHSIVLKKSAEQPKQQERLAATPHSCNDLHQSVVPTVDQLLQIFIPLYNHSFTKDFCGFPHFSSAKIVILLILRKIFADFRTFLR